MADCRHIEKC